MDALRLDNGRLTASQLHMPITGVCCVYILTATTLISSRS